MHSSSRFRLGCLFLASVFLSACAGSAGPAAATGVSGPAALERDLAAVVADPVHGMASLSVLVVRDGKVGYQGAFGNRFIHPSDPAQNKPANPQTLYRIASVSKFFTMLGVMRLVEQGKLSLDRDVGDYLGYPLRNPAFPNQPITLRMLLSHTSSMRDEAGYSWGAGTSINTAIAAKPGAWDAKRAPGAYFTYSNLNFGVIGTVLEAATGERFDLLMRRLVLDPLDLRAGYNVALLPAAERANLAALYRKRAPDTNTWNPSGPWMAQVDDYSVRPASAPAGLDQYVVGSNSTVFSPTGGLRISAADLGKVMLMLLDEGRYQGKAFLSPATLKKIFSTQWRYAPAAPNGDNYHGLFTHWGLGAQQFESADGARSSLVPGGYPAWGHLGDAYGLMSVFAINFAERSGMVVLIGGTARDPASTPGSYSALSRQEELVLSALHKHLLRAQ
jgi:CubicO group peptidase (beta-lactamase class C family)